MKGRGLARGSKRIANFKQATLLPAIMINCLHPPNPGAQGLRRRMENVFFFQTGLRAVESLYKGPKKAKNHRFFYIFRSAGRTAGRTGGGRSLPGMDFQAVIKSAASAASPAPQKSSKNERKIAFLGPLYRDSTARRPV